MGMFLTHRRHCAKRSDAAISSDRPGKDIADRRLLCFARKDAAFEGGAAC